MVDRCRISFIEAVPPPLMFTIDGMTETGLHDYAAYISSGKGIPNINHDGTKMVISGSSSLFEVDLLTPYDISTAVYSGVNVPAASAYGHVRFKSDGTQLAGIMSSTYIEVWDLPTAGSIAGMTKNHQAATYLYEYNAFEFVEGTADITEFYGPLSRISLYRSSAEWDLSDLAYVSNTTALATYLPTSENFKEFRWINSGNSAVVLSIGANVSPVPRVWQVEFSTPYDADTVTGISAQIDLLSSYYSEYLDVADGKLSLTILFQGYIDQYAMVEV